MSTRSWLTGMFIGVAFGVITVIACSDDAPGDADAAVCDCPAAEPPLSGRIMARTASVALPANTGGGGEAVCNQGETILGGGCRLMSPDGRITLSESGILRQAGLAGFRCAFSSASPIANTGLVEAICLVPAQ